jgi:serine protease inhibitor
MIFLSPRYVSLEEFENRLTVDFYRWAVQRIIDVESIFSMPLFSIQSKKTFPQLFGTGVNLDSLDDKSLTSGRLIHKTGIVVNDFGIGTAEKQMPGNTDRTEATLPPAIFFLDSPFTFWLRDQDSGVVLLAGHYASPD